MPQVAVQITLKEYLAERARRTGQTVTLTDIHQATGVALSTLSGMANNKIDRVSRRILDQILQYLNGNGEECDIGDIIVWVPDQNRVA